MSFPKINDFFDDIAYNEKAHELGASIGMTLEEVTTMSEKVAECREECRRSDGKLDVPKIVHLLGPRFTPKELSLCVATLLLYEESKIKEYESAMKGHSYPLNLGEDIDPLNKPN